MGEAESSDHRQETTVETGPPKYHEVINVGQDQLQRQPGPATCGSFYHDDRRKVAMVFSYLADVSKHGLMLSQPWSARMSVKCSDVPRLMREGFVWDDANVVREEGYINHDYKTAPYAAGVEQKWCGNRHYFLRDLQEPPRWIAMIEVFALDIKTLARFNLNQLSRKRMAVARAFGQSGQDKIYHYHFLQPDNSYNLIYDDMPMQGRWPWPGSNSKD